MELCIVIAHSRFIAVEFVAFCVVCRHQQVEILLAFVRHIFGIFIFCLRFNKYFIYCFHGMSYTLRAYAQGSDV